MKEEVKNKHFRNCTEFISLAYIKGDYSNNEIYLNEDCIKFNVYNIVFGDISKEYIKFQKIKIYNNSIFKKMVVRIIRTSI